MYTGCIPTGTCIRPCSYTYTFYTVFITIFPILYYKLHLNTVYKYSITIHPYTLPVFLHPKDGKKYMYFSSSVWGFYHIITLSLLI